MHAYHGLIKMSIVDQINRLQSLNEEHKESGDSETEEEMEAINPVTVHVIDYKNDAEENQEPPIKRTLVNIVPDSDEPVQLPPQDDGPPKKKKRSNKPKSIRPDPVQLTEQIVQLTNQLAAKTEEVQQLKAQNERFLEMLHQNAAKNHDLTMCVLDSVIAKMKPAASSTPPSATTSRRA